MSNLKLLLPGDKYDGRCAEIYITEKQCLIYHCSACEEIFTTFCELLSHITKDHYENAKELNKADIKRVETAIKQENQFTTNNLCVQQRKQTDDSERKIDKDDQSFHGAFLGTVCETIKVKNGLEKITPLLLSNKGLSQRRKLRSSPGNLKRKTMGRSVNVLTRHQASPNDERKYVCTICGFAFKEKYNLRNHLLRHSNQKQLHCSICSKNFLTKIELCLHEYRHRSERQHACFRCGMGFISSVSLTQHLRKHQLFKCGQCFKLCSTFSQAKDFKSPNIEICIECSSFNCEFFFKNKELPESNYHAAKHSAIDKAIVSTKACNACKYTQKDNLKQQEPAESEFFLEENVDEYELVQTLSDLECSKHM